MGVARSRIWVSRSLKDLTPRRAVLISVATAVVVRLWCSAGIPLTITNDGVWYLMWARQMLAHQPVEWPPARTPGYPLFLAAVFALCGVGPVCVLVAQHALGCVTIGLIAAMASRLAGPRWGLALGVLAALDPVPLAMESYALSESLACALLVACASGAVLTRKRSWWKGVALGAAIGALCLVRPAFQAAAPFLALAWLWGGREAPASQDGRSRWARRFLGATALAAGFLGATGAWLAHNWQRGVAGMSSSNTTILWVGICESGLLADDFPLPEKARAEYERSVRPAPDIDENALRFVVFVEGWNSAEGRLLLARWAVYSIRTHPGAYAAMGVRALFWQLETFPRWRWWGRQRFDEMSWLVWRLSQDGRRLPEQSLPNYNISGKPADTDLYVMPPGRGPFVRYFRWWAARWWIGVPRLALFGAALAAVCFAVRRGQWPVALVLLGTLAYVGAHAAFLLAASRYSMPCWVLWWIAPAVAAGMRRAGKACIARVPPV